MKSQNKEDSIGFLLSRSTNLLWKHLTRNFLNKGFDVTPEQFGVMMKLYHLGDMSQKTIAKLTFKDKVSITKIVNNLEKKSLIARGNDNNDKRIKIISLTKEGKNILPHLYEIANCTIERSLQNTGKSDIEGFKTVLRNIYINLSV